ncbi:MAG: EI24 domain-containing protein [Aestuariivirga sp.]
MFKAFFNALNDLTSPEFRSVLIRSILLSIGLFAGLWFGIEFLLSSLTFVPWPWLTTLLQVATGLGLFAMFFFLMAPVTALFAGLFLDGIAAKVEARHYPLDRPGKALNFVTALVFGLKFLGVSLGVNLVVLPLVLFAGFGIALLLIANAYLISREYFEMAATRFMPPAAARDLRQKNFWKIFIAGFIPGFIAIVPFVNFVTPVFATSYFVHIFKQVSKSSA